MVSNLNKVVEIIFLAKGYPVIGLQRIFETTFISPMSMYSAKCSGPRFRIVPNVINFDETLTPITNLEIFEKGDLV